MYCKRICKDCRYVDKEDAQKIYDFLKSNVISMEIPHGSEPAEEDVDAVMWWQIQKYFKDNYDIGNYQEDI